MTCRDNRHRKSSLKAALVGLFFCFSGNGSPRAGVESDGLFPLLKKQAGFFAKGK